MRPYPNLLDAVADGLAEIFDRGYYADRVVAQLLKRDRRWGSRDRAFIAETTYECVRWWRLLAFAADDERPEAILAAYWARRYGEVLDVRGYPQVYPQEVERALAQARGRRAIEESIPDWLDGLGARELGAEWPPTLHALNQGAEVFLRANTLKTDRQRLKDTLEAQGFELAWETRGADALRVVRRGNLWNTKPFRAGHFEVQDIASQQVAPALDVAPGMTVVDACAGAGGKTLHLAALMQNKGRLIALDTQPRKLAELRKRARRAGVSNLEVREITSSKVVKRLYGKADRVLLDVPCTGLGVLRRNPDAKWKLRPEFVDEVRGWQRDILAQYSRMANGAGRVLYATCSVLPSESEGQVANYLASEAGAAWRLREQRRYDPTEGYDGFYTAVLERAAIDGGDGGGGGGDGASAPDDEIERGA